MNISTPELTAAQIGDFFRRGFLTLERLTTPEDLQHISELLAALFDRFGELSSDFAVDLGDKRNHEGEQKIPQINQATQLEPELLETEYFRNASYVARQLLGDDCYLIWDHAIYKPPHNGKATPWHQDLAYPAQRNPNLVRFGVNMWMPLQDVTIESGCMQFIPYSNLGNLLPHHPVGHDSEVHTLVTDDVNPAQAVPCPIPAGGVTMHQPKTLHYTGANETDHWRRAWILNFGCPLV
ncbi:MAG TPA: phytanoyl-CoA dioxygenase family protein [Abditibacteriaceae bacterium]|nr:phytanoyl-CoA dioxygenase family protein [Abditibacteriaceae bacterium]